MQQNHLLNALDSTPLAGLTIWKCAEGWQANLQLEGSDGWSVCIEPTPGAALCAVLGVEAAPAILPPPPY